MSEMTFLIIFSSYFIVSVFLSDRLTCQKKDFYKKHDPTGKILHFTIIDCIKTITYALVAPLGIWLIIRNWVYDCRVRKIKNGKEKNKNE